MFLLCALVTWGNAWGDEVTCTFSSKYNSNTVLDGNSISFDSEISATFNKKSGGTATQYYTNGTAVRWYGGGTLVITAATATMSKIEITFTQTANSISANVGTYSLANNVGTWTGSASSVTLTQSGTSGQCRISAIKVTYASASTDPGITLNKTSLDFGEVEAASSKQMTFTVTPANLTAGLSLSCNNDKYTVSPTSISKDASGAQTITVTANPTSVNDNMDGTITISGDDFADDTEVTLSTTVVRKSAGLAFDPTSVTLTRGEAFAAPTFNKDAGILASAISFTSSYNDVATVSDEGVISLGTSTGTAIIKASFAQTDVYAAGEATCAITVNPAGVTPEPSATGYYEKVTSDAGLIDGAAYLVVNEGAQVALGAQNGAYRDAESVTFDEDVITEIGNATIITLVQSNDKWKLRLGDTKYYTTAAAKNMSEGDTGTEAEISFDASGNVVIDFGTTPGKLYYNSGSPRFLNYTSSQTKIQLYKFVAGAAPSNIDIYVSEAGYATYASNFDLDFTSVSGLKAYIAKEVSSEIKMEQVNKVPKETGVLLRVTDGGGKTYNVPTAATTDDVTGNLFKRGNDAAVATDGGEDKTNYILNVVNNKLGFYKAAGNTVAKNKAYLQTAIAAARIELVFDEGTAGISNLTSALSKGEGVVYDLSGRRVVTPAKGLYIVNGKKVIVK